MVGILWQVDRSDVARAPADQVRRAIGRCVERNGWRPVAVQVHPGEWPAEIDGVSIVPTPRMGFPSLMLLVQSV